LEAFENQSMSVQFHLATLETDDLVDIYRHWAGDIGAPTGDEALIRGELARLMTDRDRVLQRYRELPSRCRDFLAWLVGQEGYAVPLSRLDEEGGDLPVKPFEVDAVAFALKKRGFLLESRDRSWMHFDEPAYRVPQELAEVLNSLLSGGERSFESQLSLRAFLRALPRKDLLARARRLGLEDAAQEGRGAILKALSRSDVARRALENLEPPLSEVAGRLAGDLGGLADIRHLERLGYDVPEDGSWRSALEGVLLGTTTSSDLTGVGLRLGQGSPVIFLEIVQALLAEDDVLELEEEPEPLADVLADIQAVRTFLDHHSVRMTRDGTLYRATQRKMAGEVLSPGSRPVDPEEALEFILRFLMDADLVRQDRSGRLRNGGGWEEYDKRGPVDRTDLLLTYVINDLRGIKGSFHQQRLRKLLLTVMSEAGAGRWLAVRPLAMQTRARYLLGLDLAATAERYQKRYKYAPLPALVGPTQLVRDLVDFMDRDLSLAGVVEVQREDEVPVAVRLTRLGAAVLGLAVEEDEPGPDQGALIVTADFEVVLLPEAGGIELIHEVGRFARREKADYSIHFRIQQRTVQEAVTSGMSAQEIVDVLVRHGRHDLPQNVDRSIREWAEKVRVLRSSRTLLLRAPDKKSLDAALKIRELKAIAAERLNDTTLELKEDPSTAKIAEALRAQGFFLR
jgi:hypothetical protein